MLERLRLKNVGPAPEMDLELAPRLNLITGDNGLGKTVLLDTAWYALTRTWPFSWPGRGIVPSAADAEVAWRERRDTLLPWCGQKYDYVAGRWSNVWTAEQKEASKPGALVVFARVDGGFSLSDPYRVGQDYRLPFGQTARGTSSCFQFDAAEVWDGLDLARKDSKVRVCEGLVRDWRSWASDPAEPSFERFARVVQAMAPAEGIVVPLRSWRRVFVDDPRDIPLLRTSAGDLPIVHAPASVKRIVALAYMVVWAWKEHLVAAALQKREPLRSLVLLVDEVESHLHPQWQRRIAPAIVELAAALDPDVSFQTILTTHSPMVLASLEPSFDEQQDRVFHLHTDAGTVRLHEVPWAKQGDATNWLVSEVFGLERARSVEAEKAIRAAYAFMRGEPESQPEGLRTRDEIHAELQRVLGGHDDFWPRWIVWVEAQGSQP